MHRPIMTCDEIAGLSRIRTAKSVPNRAPHALDRMRISPRGNQPQKIAAAGRTLAARRAVMTFKRWEHN